MKKVELFFHDFLLHPFKYVYRETKFREVLNEDPVTKMCSTDSQFLNLPNPNIRSAIISILKVIEL